MANKELDNKVDNHIRQTGSIIWMDNWLVWQWCRKEYRERGMGRIEHLFAEIIGQYLVANGLSEEESKKLNSTEALHGIYKRAAAKEGLNISSFIEKVCMAEMERACGLKIVMSDQPKKKTSMWDLNAGVQRR